MVAKTHGILRELCYDTLLSVSFPVVSGKEIHSCLEMCLQGRYFMKSLAYLYSKLLTTPCMLCLKCCANCCHSSCLNIFGAHFIDLRRSKYISDIIFFLRGGSFYTISCHTDLIVLHFFCFFLNILHFVFPFDIFTGHRILC